jgi:hypothetical protein
MFFGTGNSSFKEFFIILAIENKKYNLEEEQTI